MCDTECFEVGYYKLLIRDGFALLLSVYRCIGVVRFTLSSFSLSLSLSFVRSGGFRECVCGVCI